MPTASWNGHVIAEGDTVVVERNHYFAREAVKMDLLEDSATHSTCPWKGEARYKTIVVDGARNVDAAWFYPAPKDAAKEIAGRFAFWKGVEVG